MPWGCDAHAVRLADPMTAPPESPKPNLRVGIVAVVLVAGGCGAFIAWGNSGGSTGRISVTVRSWGVEDQTAVYANVLFGNSRKAAAIARCTIVALDGRGTDVGSTIGGPADPIPPNGSTLVRLVIGTTVGAAQVAQVEQDPNNATC